MKKYDNIQVFRVLACLGVFVTHLSPRMGATGWAAKAANFGASGVYLFFLISGFLACGSTDIAPDCERRGIFTYYAKRLFRILPLYYVVILYNMALHGLLLQDVPPDPAGLAWLRYFFLTNAFIPGPDNFWSNLSATWTVSLFCFFYLCAPLFVRLIAGKKGTQDRTPEGKVLRAALLYLAVLLLRYIWVGAGLSSYMMAFYYLHFFVLGMLVYALQEAYRPLAAALKFGVFALALGGLLWLSGAGNDYFTMISWIFAILILISGRFSWRRDEKGQLCYAARVIGVLDAHSYAVYLVHAVVIDGIALLQAHVNLTGAAVLGTAVVLTAIGAYFARRLIEKPAGKLGRRLVTGVRI
ncbi:MAG: acyltransferase [Eubacteriales bacterium]|nr:acyltransferase [Eubacteriales bacterium]